MRCGAGFVGVQPRAVHMAPTLAECTAAAVLKFFIVFERGALHFCFALGPPQVMYLALVESVDDTVPLVSWSGSDELPQSGGLKTTQRLVSYSCGGL